MSHQVNFYLTPTDVAVLEKRLQGIEPLLILLNKSENCHPFVLNSMDYVLHGKPWLYFYLVRPEDFGAVAMRHVPAQGYWTVDVMKSPVIEFNKSFFDNKTLRRGRLYYMDSYYNSDGLLQNKSEAFRNWAKKVFAFVRKGSHKVGAEYVGKDANAWLETAAGRFEQ